VSTLLILASVTVWNAQALAQTPGQVPGQVPGQAPAPSAQPVAPAQTTAPLTTVQPPVATNAAATPQQNTDPVGSVPTLQGSASVTHNNTSSALKLSQSIYKGDTVQTGADGTMGITFDDDTTFTLKPNSQMMVDDFVYQKGGSSNAATFNILRGTAAFVA